MGAVELVGPVLETGETANAVIAAIRSLNEGDIVLQNRGAYVRILVPDRCIVTCDAIQKELGHPFTLPGDLECIMPSFKGAFEVSEEQAVWSFGAKAATDKRML